MQTFIESGHRKVNEIQVRSDDLQGFFHRYDTTQNDLELSDNTDHFGDRELFENQYYEFKAKFSELLYPVIDTPRSRNSSLRSSGSGHSNHTPSSHTSSTRIKLTTIAMPIFEGDTCSWLHFRDTFEALIVNNTNLSNFQTFQYLISSLKNEAKDLIRKLQITN